MLRILLIMIGDVARVKIIAGFKHTSPKAASDGSATCQSRLG